MLSLMDAMVSLVVKVLWKLISLICFRVYLEVNVHKNPTCFNRWSVSYPDNIDEMQNIYENIDWFINHYPELEQIREFMETLSYSYGFRFLYSKKSGELFYRNCYQEEMHLIWRIGE